MSDQLSSDLASLRIARDDDPRRRGWLKPLVWLVLLGGAAAGAYLVGLPYLEAQVYKTEVSLTEIARVSPAQASINLTSTGYVVAQRQSNVAVKIPGKVSKIYVAQGAKVQAGDVLFEIDPADQQAAIAASQSRVAAARAQAQQVRAQQSELAVQMKRALALAEAGVGPKSAADDLAARSSSMDESIKAADAQARASQAEVEALRVSLGNFRVTAPISGTVLNKPPEVGEFVGPQPAGVAVDMGGVQIADFTTLTVETDVPEARLSLVKIEGPAEISLDAYPDRRLRGKVLEVTPLVNRSKATVTVKVSFIDATEGVLPDMAARVSFLASALDEKALKEPPKTIVPGSAVVDRGGAKVVFVAEDGVAHMRSVELGPPFGTGFELLKGPGPGARLIKEPPATMKDGQRIKERTES
jgi:HlyD family secretion protein